MVAIQPERGIVLTLENDTFGMNTDEARPLAQVLTRLADLADDVLPGQLPDDDLESR